MPASKATKATSEWKRRRAAYQRERTARMRADGKCKRCSRPLDRDATLCSICHENQSAYYKMRQQAMRGDEEDDDSTPA